MGSLKKLRLPSADIGVPNGGDFPVRGVSLRDVAMLVRHHGPALASLFQEIRDGKDLSLDIALVLRLGESAISAAPELCSDIIALASGEPDAEAREVARQLPFPVQLEAIKQIALLTFGGEDSLGKMVETVVHMAQGVSSAVTELQKPLTNGSAVSATQ